MPTPETLIRAAPYLAAIAATTTLLVLSVWRWPRGERWAKPAASAAFLVAALVVAPGSGPGLWILAGLVFCALGDLLLLQRGTGWGFKAGLVAFLVGHLGYLAFFLSAGVSLASAGWAALPMLAAAGVVGWRVIPRAPRKLAPAVCAYVVVITLMVIAAYGRVLDDAIGAPLLAAAASLFWVSDIFVARQRFIAPGLVNRVVGLPLYYAAQAGFALSLWPQATGS